MMRKFFLVLVILSSFFTGMETLIPVNAAGSGLNRTCDSGVVIQTYDSQGNASVLCVQSLQFADQVAYQSPVYLYSYSGGNTSAFPHSNTYFANSIAQYYNPTVSSICQNFSQECGTTACHLPITNVGQAPTICIANGDSASGNGCEQPMQTNNGLSCGCNPGNPTDRSECGYVNPAIGACDPATGAGCQKFDFSEVFIASFDCTELNVKNDVANDQRLMYCEPGSVIETICAQPGMLRAAVGVTRGDQSVHFTQADNLTTDVQAVDFYCVNGANNPPGQINLPTKQECLSAYDYKSDICDFSSAAPQEGGVLACANATYASSPAHKDECACTFDTKSQKVNGNSYTVLGCIPPGVGATVNVFLALGIGLGAFFSFIFMIIGAYEIMTHPTDPDELEEGRKKIVNALLGLLLIIFCVIILKILGVNILGISYLTNIVG
jgi:hypothetical protein